jgi:osmotically-inducible protein OsmY
MQDMAVFLSSRVHFGRSKLDERKKRDSGRDEQGSRGSKGEQSLSEPRADGREQARVKAAVRKKRREQREERRREERRVEEEQRRCVGLRSRCFVSYDM